MALKRQIGSGPNFTPAYQTSGVPFVTGSNQAGGLTTSAVKVEFPYVTRFFQIECTGDKPLVFGFTENAITDNPSGMQAHCMYVSGSGSTPRLELRCTDIWISAIDGNTDYTLIAGLTGIERGAFPTLSGSNGFHGVG